MARILIADDASFMRQMIREIVESEGHEVVGEASDGVEAFVHACTQRTVPHRIS